MFLKKTAIGSIVLLTTPSLLFSRKLSSSIEDKLFSTYCEIDSQFPLSTQDSALLVDGEQQKMYLVNGSDGFTIHKEYSISTAKKGFGGTKGSYKTPLGIHKIYSKIGDGAPVGTLFKKQVNRGYTVPIYTDKKNHPGDYITTRILTLQGLEQHNKFSLERGIFFHGTNEEGLIGTPASFGCIRMINTDIVELYDLVSKGTYVNIKERLV